ncbi:MAG: type IV secretion system protein [Methylotenera sp.]|nr:type IV secretion system protein [Methylotenera sp.]
MDLSQLFPNLSTLQMLIILDNTLQTAQAAMFFYSETVIAGVRTFAKFTAIIFVFLYGWGMVTGQIKEPIQETWNRLFKLFAVVSIALSITAYKPIAEFIWDLPTWLTDTLIPSSIVTFLQNFLPVGTSDMPLMLVSVFMSAVVQIMTNGFQSSNIGGDTDPTAWAAAFGIGAAGVSLSAIVAGILLVAKFSLSVLVALGPFFIMSILFEKTKHYFDGWLAQVTNFIVVILIMTITIYILFPVILIAVSSYYLIMMLIGSLSLTESVELVTLMGIYIAIMRQVPTTAAALVRGYAVGSPQEKTLKGHGNDSDGGKSSNQQQAEVNNAQRTK